MKKWFVLLTLLVAFSLALSIVVACDDDDDDDDDDNDDDDDFSQFPLTLSGTFDYDGAKTGDQIMIALTDQWPMTEAPLWFGYVDTPAAFPAEYKIGVDYEFFGDYYILALIDVNPADGTGMNPDVDPLAIPTQAITLAAGENTGIDFTFIDPEDIGDDDDDDDNDDNDTVDDDDDDDTVATTGISGTLTYTGAFEGAKVVFGFWDGLPMMAPDHSAEVDVPEGGFPFDYEVETDFDGDWRIVAFLDVDPNDGDSINFDVDPTNWAMTLPFTTITDGQMTDLDITLVDPD